MRTISTASLHTPLRTVVLSDNQRETLVNDQGFSIEEILGWVTAGESYLVGWDIDQQVNVWFSLLPHESRVDLFSGIETNWNGWRFQYIPSKMLEVKHRRKLWRLCDVSGFWEGGRSFTSVLTECNLSYTSTLFDAMVRQEWRQNTLEEIITLADERSHDLSTLVDWLLPQLETHDLKPARLYGVGSIASKLIKDTRDDHWIARYRPDRQPIIDTTELLPIFLQAYYGGRQETTVQGSWERPTYGFDIRSAYPWALSWLGPVGFFWAQADRFSASIDDRMSVWYVSWDVRPSFMGPFPFRELPGRPMVYPQQGRGWYWWPEVRAAIAAYGESSIRVHRGYVAPSQYDQPLRPMIKNRYRQRQQLAAAHSPIEGILKRSLAAVYGKFAQSEAAEGKPGRWYNPALAGWVTSAVRSRLIEAWAGQEGIVCAASTDGLLTTLPPLRIRRSDALGGWKRTVWNRATLVLPGLYRLQTDTDQVTAMSGVSGGLDFDKLLKGLGGSRRVDVYQRWFVPNLLADLFPERWEGKRCRWVTGSVTINPHRMAHKRQVNDNLYGLRWADDHLSYPPYADRGDEDSVTSPLPPAWRDRRPTLTELALSKLLS